MIDRLKTVEADLGAEPADLDGAALYNKALMRAVLRKGRRAMRRAETMPCHPAPPPVAQGREGALASRALPTAPAAKGRAHDHCWLSELGDSLVSIDCHAVLAEKLAFVAAHDPALMRQLALIAGERRTLEAKAFALGRRTYRKPARIFARAMRLE